MTLAANKLSVTVSGSFHRHIDDVGRAVAALKDLGIQVLSPEDPRVVDAEGPFLFVASDRHRAIRLVQDRHLASITRSDFLWLVCPDGYVGPSAACEIGFAVAAGTPVYASHKPADLTLQEYVTVVQDLSDAVREARERPRLATSKPSLLITPDEVVEEAGRNLEELGRLLGGRSRISDGRELTTRVNEALHHLREALSSVSPPR